MAWRPEFTQDLFLRVQNSNRKETLRIALLAAKSEVESAESLQDMPSLGRTRTGLTAFFSAGCIILCHIDETAQTCTFTDIAI